MKQYLIYVTVLGLAALLASPVQAAKEEKINLIATIDDQPALRPVTWVVYKIDNNGQDKLVKNGNRHVFTIDIEPGTYAAVAKAENYEKRYEFTVRANTPRDLLVPLN